MKKVIKVVVYDLDGTVLDSLPVHYLAIQAVCSMCGVSIPPLNEVCRFWYAPYYERFREFGVTLSPDYLWSIYNKKVNGGISPVFPELVTTLDDLWEQAVKLFVVTTCGQEFAEKKLQRNFVRHYFAGVYGDQEDKTKALRKIIASCGVTPGELLFIGDMKSDILDGKKARVRTIGFDGGYGGRETLLGAGAETVITSHKQILQYF